MIYANRKLKFEKRISPKWEKNEMKNHEKPKENLMNAHVSPPPGLSIGPKICTKTHTVKTDFYMVDYVIFS